MSDIVAERSGSILRIQLNRPARKNAMTSAMYMPEAKEAFTAFLEKRAPDFTKAKPRERSRS